MRKSVNLLLLIVWIVIIFMLTGFPALESPKIKELPVDKFYHFILFFVYGFLALRTMNILAYFISGGLVIIGAEVQQLFIPGRDFEYFDIVAGGAGLVAIYLVSTAKKIRKV